MLIAELDGGLQGVWRGYQPSLVGKLTSDYFSEAIDKMFKLLVPESK